MQARTRVVSSNSSFLVSTLWYFTLLRLRRLDLVCLSARRPGTYRIDRLVPVRAEPPGSSTSFLRLQAHAQSYFLLSPHSVYSLSSIPDNSLPLAFLPLCLLRPSCRDRGSRPSIRTRSHVRELIPCIRMVYSKSICPEPPLLTWTGASTAALHPHRTRPRGSTPDRDTLSALFLRSCAWVRVRKE